MQLSHHLYKTVALKQSVISTSQEAAILHCDFQTMSTPFDLTQYETSTKAQVLEVLKDVYEQVRNFTRFWTISHLFFCDVLS